MSSSTCITSNYSNFKHEPDRRFPRPVDAGGGGRNVPVVDSKSCRQLYLRTAYTFTRQEEKESDKIEKAKKCLSKVKDRVTLVYKGNHHHANTSLKVMRYNNKNDSSDNNNNKGIVIYNKVKEYSYASILSMLRRMLACTSAKVDVAEH